MIGSIVLSAEYRYTGWGRVFCATFECAVRFCPLLGPLRQVTVGKSAVFFYGFVCFFPILYEDAFQAPCFCNWLNYATLSPENFSAFDQKNSSWSRTLCSSTYSPGSHQKTTEGRSGKSWCQTAAKETKATKCPRSWKNGCNPTILQPKKRWGVA